MTRLSNSTLGDLPPDVARPAYDRATIRPGIVHFGVGAFHRSHEAMFVDRVLELGRDGWGIVGVGTLPSDRAMKAALVPQDCLYTLVTTSPEGTSSARVIGSIVEYLYAPDDPASVLARLADPATRIVSLTITEGGYGVTDVTGEFQPHDEATIADLDGLPNGAAPRSPLGFITEGLRMRRDVGHMPFTVMSCDNIQGNGIVARTALLAFANHIDPGLARWIETDVRFPNSMVDRITPATTAQARASVAERFGVDDRWPVLSESFEQWVLEDSFSDGRPPLERVGVQLVDDVEPYEVMKLRLLNASHQAMSYLGLLAGETYVHEVCRDEVFAAFLRGYMEHEARPTLSPVPGVDLDAYCDELMRRFSSEAISDTLARQIVDGSERIPKFLLPVVREQLRTGGPVDRSALVLAAWSRLIEGRADDGTPLEPVDRRLSDLRAAVAQEASSPGAFLGLTAVFGDLGSNVRLREAFIAARADLQGLGARGAVERVNATA
ncbi:mannitol dehydrogenase family protein [Mycetocola miduiensis]|uniref:Mannitol-1-phosphate 5-dehydrogenase n=1 Tax=Mycetocola miduiensis TaxID=995034 RepID=A0A1I4YE82_9MICO|nr:mannitol dehydrogenase family protein [Mycetocola miduiensis]SFN36358.1 mannitol 2-dehydrogenase [Mycetocola miduiensis]